MTRLRAQRGEGAFVGSDRLGSGRHYDAVVKGLIGVSQCLVQALAPHSQLSNFTSLRQFVPLFTGDGNTCHLGF